jgi:ABC-type antimicrobial peptide transport system permease subunit
MVTPNVRPILIGLVLGTVFSTLLAIESDRFLNAIFPVKLVDSIAFLLAVFSLVVAVTVAMLIPARRATMLHPALVLRQD